ncbi:Serine/threonine-protein kinase [Lachnellula willkommii]|uniref:non-specific serine/threonine protein kinase n=1 Tax=Lachnellula willkommii TaxID=215461 RepID=A0A559M3M1_9HELO|nr:Serine/threonine-protein kinase [Lachnellula willkommii]
MYESDHDLDIQLEDGPLDQLYERGWLPADAEDREEYQLGGFHPVHIGDRFGTAGRFRVIHKLGRGGLATIIIADESGDESSGLRFANKEGLDFGEAGGECVAVPHEHFWHDGPNGRHLCLVLPVLGPRVSALWGTFKDPARVSQDIALQRLFPANTVLSIYFRPSNILLRLTVFDDLSEHELIDLFGEPNKEPLVTISGERPAPSGPEYLVESLDLDCLPARFISDQISIIDFGESYHIHSPPADLGITASFRSPELLFDNTIGVGCDMWALACTLYEVRTNSPLFENFMDDDEVIMQMVPLLGKLPEPWWSAWGARGRWYNEGATPLVDPETGRPYMLTDTLEELLSDGGSSSSLLLGDSAEGKKNRAGGFVVGIKESRVLGGLLRGILKYDPEERMSVEAVL